MQADPSVVGDLTMRKRLRSDGEGEREHARAQKSLRGMRRAADDAASISRQKEEGSQGTAGWRQGMDIDDVEETVNDGFPGLLVVREAGGTWRAVSLSIDNTKKQARFENEDEAQGGQQKRRTLGRPSGPSLPEVIVVERTEPGGLWKAATSNHPRQPCIQEEKTVEKPAPQGEEQQDSGKFDAEGFYKEPPQMVVQRDAEAGKNGSTWEAIVAGHDGDLYYESDMRAACSDLGPQVPTDLTVGDGASIEQALDAFEEALLSLASNMCTKRMAIEKMQKMTSGAPEPAMNVDDDDDDGNLTEDMELDEPEFDSMEACYKVLFELIDNVLIKMLDELPTGDADVDVPATSIDDAEAVGRMSRPAHILEELVDILRLLRLSETSLAPLTSFEFHVDVIAVWRMAKESGNPAVWSIAEDLSIAFDKLYRDEVYAPMQAINDRVATHIPRLGYRCRVYDEKNHEWWLGSVKSHSADEHKVLVVSTKERDHGSSKVWVRVPSFNASIISPSEYYLFNEDKHCPKLQHPWSDGVYDVVPFSGPPSPTGGPHPSPPPSPCTSSALQLSNSRHFDPDLVIIPRAYSSQRKLLINNFHLPGYGDMDFTLDDDWIVPRPPSPPPPQETASMPRVLSLVPQPLPQTELLPAPKQGAGGRGTSLGLGWFEGFEEGEGGGSTRFEGKRLTVEEAAAELEAKKKLWVEPTERPDYDSAMVAHVKEHGEGDWGPLHARFPEMTAGYFRQRWQKVKWGRAKIGGCGKKAFANYAGVSKAQRIEMAKKYDDEIRRHLKEHGPGKWYLLEEKFPERITPSKPGSGKYFAIRYRQLKGKPGYWPSYS